MNEPLGENGGGDHMPRGGKSHRYEDPVEDRELPEARGHPGRRQRYRQKNAAAHDDEARAIAVNHTTDERHDRSEQEHGEGDHQREASAVHAEV